MKFNLRHFIKRDEGAVTIESSLIIMILIILTGGAIEASYAFYQFNSAQQAVRTGVRIAATSDPVASSLNAVTSGNATRNFEISCTDDGKRCSFGSYNSAAMERIIFGPDQDGVCGATTRLRRGMCDIFRDTQNAHVDVSYISSGFGTAGNQGDAAPLVSVTLREVPLNFVFLNLVGFDGLLHLPPVEATLMGEDLRNG